MEMQVQSSCYQNLITTPQIYTVRPDAQNPFDIFWDMLVNILFYIYLQVYKRLLQKIFNHSCLLCATLKSHTALEKVNFQKQWFPAYTFFFFKSLMVSVCLQGVKIPCQGMSFSNVPFPPKKFLTNTSWLCLE